VVRRVRSGVCSRGGNNVVTKFNEKNGALVAK
jgi:hypothetical protein